MRSSQQPSHRLATGRPDVHRRGFISLLGVTLMVVVVTLGVLVAEQTRSEIVATRQERTLVSLSQLVVAGEVIGRENLSQPDAVWGEQPLPQELVAAGATLVISRGDDVDGNAQLTVTALLDDTRRSESFLYQPTGTGWTLLRVTSQPIARDRDPGS